MGHRARVGGYLPLFGSTLAVFGLASAASGALGIDLDESLPLWLSDVRYQWVGCGLKVGGRVHKPEDRYGRIVGHVEVLVLDGEGRLLLRRSGPLQTHRPRRKDHDWASFHIHIDSVPSGAERIRLRSVVRDG